MAIPVRLVLVKSTLGLSMLLILLYCLIFSDGTDLRVFVGLDFPPNRLLPVVTTHDVTP